ncbi:hypothetical protein SVA_2537 [Sulfurifustis variabilis]|uniref:Uncharacterized protein n=1 Tax=Sulfurifustis variabilis TaxID=1675686 RepID=A0A1B4V6N3_9GAMM|nr:DUF5985 family protein [Sulfurifustis variabilis]BAU49085.1 hypothetical protein SVA_2537 [Sulfurifustis variabilis]
MIEFLAGAVTLAHIVSAVYFLRFWRKTSDRLFLSFAVAFGLLALNQIAVSVIGAADERTNYAYILRVLGFILIFLAIIDKNVFAVRKGKRRAAPTTPR